MFDINDGKAQAPELIPHGTLAFAIASVKGSKQSKNTGGTMFNIELTLVGGQHEGRKVFDLVPDITDNRNSEGFIKMGKAKIVQMFETIGFFKPSDPSTYKQFGSDFNAAMTRLDGNRVAVRIVIEKSKDPAYSDKNKVGDYLSSNPVSGGYRDYVKLIGGQATVSAARKDAFAPAQPAATAAPGWIKTPTPPASSSTDAPF